MSRRVELDTLRGLLLVIMALTHLPTRLRSYSDQPLGFVSAAEGFVFLAAFVAAESHVPLLVARGARYVRSRLWSRAARVYGYHLALLALAFTIVAAFAAVTGRPSLKNLLTFYFDSPGVALVSGPLLLYQPPLLDILPMYIIFLGLSPLLLEVAERRGFRPLLLASGLLWLAAQLGARRALHEAFCAFTGLRVPLEATGSFDLLGWQLLWMLGLWAGHRYREGGARVAPALLWAAAPLALVFLVWRHRAFGFNIELGPLWSWLDKWHLGPLRLLNFGVLALLIARGLGPFASFVRVGALALLGRASLQVFTVHLLLCMWSLGLVVDDATPLTSGEELVVLLATFGSMLLVAWRASIRRPGRGLTP